MATQDPPLSRRERLAVQLILLAATILVGGSYRLRSGVDKALEDMRAEFGQRAE